MKLINKLFKIVGEHGGQISNSEEGATHIIEWNDEIDNLPEELTEDYIRILERKQTPTGGDALVHWWYYPDSYNEWINIADVNSEDPPDLSYIFTKRDKWTVCCRFITDCSIFNEWGNELDYENEGGEEDEATNTNSNSNAMDAASPTGLRKKGRRGGSKIPQAAASHKASRDIVVPEALLVTNKISPELLPPSLQAANSTSFLEITVNPADEVSSALSPSDEKPAKASATAEHSKKKRKRGQWDGASRYPPWFDLTTISDTEKLFLKDTLRRLTPQTEAEETAEFLRVKKAIVDLYGANPNQYLSATDCRKKIVGDVGFIIKLHGFLDAYDIINCDVSNEQRPRALPLPSLRLAIDSAAKAVATLSAQSGQEESKWTAAMDRALQDSVLENPNRWDAVASSLSLVAPFSVTAEDCLTRFLALYLDCMASDDSKSNIEVIHSMIRFKLCCHNIFSEDEGCAIECRGDINNYFAAEF